MIRNGKEMLKAFNVLLLLFFAERKWDAHFGWQSWGSKGGCDVMTAFACSLYQYAVSARVGTDGLTSFLAMKRKGTASAKMPVKMSASMDSAQSLDAVPELESPSVPAEVAARGDAGIASQDNSVSRELARVESPPALVELLASSPGASGVPAPARAEALASSLEASGVPALARAEALASSPGASGVPVAFRFRRKTSSSRRSVATCPVECGNFGGTARESCGLAKEVGRFEGMQGCS